MMNQSSAETAVQEELEAYLNEKGVNSLFVKIVEHLLFNKPDNPVEETSKFSIGRQKSNNSIQQKNSAVGNVETKEEIDVYSDDDDEEDEDEYVADLPETKVNTVGRGRRISVSASVLTIDQNEAKVVFAKTPEEEATLRSIISKNWLCSHLDEAEIKTIVDAMEKQEVESDVDIIRQGDRVAEHYYIIETGNASVFKDEQQVCTYTDGEAFGELALMYNTPRAATVKSTSQCTIWRLAQKVFKITLMGSAIKKREKINQYLMGVKLLEEMAENERMVLADSMTEVKFEGGQEVCIQGQPGDEFFIIAEGKVTVLVNGQDVGELTEGQYFGEIALLTNKPRQATIVASGDVKLLSVHRKVFQRVLGNLSDILKRNMKVYSQLMVSGC